MRVLSGLFSILVTSLSVPAQSADYRLLRIDGFILKWGEPALGQGAEISYGFATERESFADAINCAEMGPMAALASAWGGDSIRLERVAAEAFAMWSGAADIVFRRAEPDERPDILIGAQAEPRRVAFANVWYDAAVARSDVAPLTRAAICFNPTVAWTTEDEHSNDDRQDLRTALAHEIGHAIGLDHPGATGALMGFEDQGALSALQPGDVAGARALYGSRGGRVLVR